MYIKQTFHLTTYLYLMRKKRLTRLVFLLWISFYYYYYLLKCKYMTIMNDLFGNFFISLISFSCWSFQANNLRVMLLGMVDDPRVVLIKLADRLHNMRTMYALFKKIQIFFMFWYQSGKRKDLLSLICIIFKHVCQSVLSSSMYAITYLFTVNIGICLAINYFHC